jgi:ribonuclease VapC
MIVVDTSAIVAILLEEPEAAALLDALVTDDRPVMSAATLLETSIVLRTHDRRKLSEDDLDDFVTDTIEVMDVTAAQVDLARRAHSKFGKGTGHPARLNFGDCFSYALAKSLAAPLLYKGGDFAKTDITSAV